VPTVLQHSEGLIFGNGKAVTAVTDVNIFTAADGGLT
jgi:hypothetical protein